MIIGCWRERLGGGTWPVDPFSTGRSFRRPGWDNVGAAIAAVAWACFPGPDIALGPGGTGGRRHGRRLTRLVAGSHRCRRFRRSLRNGLGSIRL
jgi:hypothetical protein